MYLVQRLPERSFPGIERFEEVGASRVCFSARRQALRTVITQRGITQSWDTLEGRMPVTIATTKDSKLDILKRIALQI